MSELKMENSIQGYSDLDLREMALEFAIRQASPRGAAIRQASPCGAEGVIRTARLFENYLRGARSPIADIGDNLAGTATFLSDGFDYFRAAEEAGMDRFFKEKVPEAAAGGGTVGGDGTAVGGVGTAGFSQRAGVTTIGEIARVVADHAEQILRQRNEPKVDWSNPILHEPAGGLNFERAIAAVKQGKTVKRRKSGAALCLHNGELSWQNGEGERWRASALTVDSLFADDWIIVEGPSHG